MNNSMQQMQMQQIQNMMNQLSSLYSQVSAPNADPIPQLSPTPQKAEPRIVKSVHGIEEARAAQGKLSAGESMILLDDAESVFYFIMKDKDGKAPRKIQVGKFTLEDEPDPPKYVTQDDLAAFKQDILDAIKGGAQ
jgi:hypothetical protein